MICLGRPASTGTFPRGIRRVLYKTSSCVHSLTPANFTFVLGLKDRLARLCCFSVVPPPTAPPPGQNKVAPPSRSVAFVLRGHRECGRRWRGACTGPGVCTRALDSSSSGFVYRCVQAFFRSFMRLQPNPTCSSRPCRRRCRHPSLYVPCGTLLTESPGWWGAGARLGALSPR